MPGGRLGQQDMAHQHHHEIHAAHDDEHLPDAVDGIRVQDALHDGAGDGLRRAEARHSQAGGQALVVREPEHQGLDGGQIAGAQAHAHDEAIADEDADQHQDVAVILAAHPDQGAGAQHARAEADGGDQGGTVDVLLHHVAQERRAHAQEEDGQAERPFHAALGEADVVGNLLAEHRPAIDRADAAVQQQRRNGAADPFVLTLDVHWYLPLLHTVCAVRGSRLYRRFCHGAPCTLPQRPRWYHYTVFPAENQSVPVGFRPFPPIHDKSSMFPPAGHGHCAQQRMMCCAWSAAGCPAALPGG